MNDLNNNFEKNQNGEKEGLEFNNKIIKLKNEINHIKKKIKENKESGIKYYLNILKEGNDNRNIGLSWVIKRLLRLDYTPKLKDFPEYINKEVYDYLIINAINKNIILDCLQELGEIKYNLFNKIDNKTNKNKNDKVYSFIDNDNLNNICNKNKNELMEKKLKTLLLMFSFWTINPEIQLKIESLCATKNTKLYENDNNLNKNKVYNTFKLQRNKSQSFFRKNTFGNLYKDEKEREMLDIIKRVIKLKNKIKKSYIVLNNLKKDIINYIKKLLNIKNNNDIIDEKYYLLKKEINKDSVIIKIIRNLIGNENKIKDINNNII